MCKVGDIILVNRYRHNGQDISKYSYIEINDENGKYRPFVVT